MNMPQLLEHLNELNGQENPTSSTAITTIGEAQKKTENENLRKTLLDLKNVIEENLNTDIERITLRELEKSNAKLLKVLNALKKHETEENSTVECIESNTEHKKLRLEAQDDDTVNILSDEEDINLPPLEYFNDKNRLRTFEETIQEEEEETRNRDLYNSESEDSNEMILPDRHINNDDHDENDDGHDENDVDHDEDDYDEDARNHDDHNEDEVHENEKPQQQQLNKNEIAQRTNNATTEEHSSTTSNNSYKNNSHQHESHDINVELQTTPIEETQLAEYNESDAIVLDDIDEFDPLQCENDDVVLETLSTLTTPTHSDEIEGAPTNFNEQPTTSATPVTGTIIAINDLDDNDKDDNELKEIHNQQTTIETHPDTSKMEEDDDDEVQVIEIRNSPILIESDEGEENDADAEMPNVSNPITDINVYPQSTVKKTVASPALAANPAPVASLIPPATIAIATQLTGQEQKQKQKHQQQQHRQQQQQKSKQRILATIDLLDSDDDDDNASKTQMKQTISNPEMASNLTPVKRRLLPQVQQLQYEKQQQQQQKEKLQQQQQQQKQRTSNSKRTTTTATSARSLKTHASGATTITTLERLRQSVSYTATPQTTFLNAFDLFPTKSLMLHPPTFQAHFSNKQVIIPNAFYGNPLNPTTPPTTTATTAATTTKITATTGIQISARQSLMPQRGRPRLTPKPLADQTTTTTTTDMSESAYSNSLRIKYQQQELLDSHYSEWLKNFIKRFTDPQQFASHSCFGMLQKTLKHRSFQLIKDRRLQMNEKARECCDKQADMQIEFELNSAFFMTVGRKGLTKAGRSFCELAANLFGNPVTLTTDAKSGSVTSSTHTFSDFNNTTMAAATAATRQTIDGATHHTQRKYQTYNGNAAPDHDDNDTEYTPDRAILLYHQKKNINTNNDDRKKSLRTKRTRRLDESFSYNENDIDTESDNISDADNENDNSNSGSNSNSNNDIDVHAEARAAANAAAIQRKIEQKRLEAKRRTEQQAKSFESAFIHTFLKNPTNNNNNCNNKTINRDNNKLENKPEAQTTAAQSIIDFPPKATYTIQNTMRNTAVKRKRVPHIADLEELKNAHTDSENLLTPTWIEVFDDSDDDVPLKKKLKIAGKQKQQRRDTNGHNNRYADEQEDYVDEPKVHRIYKVLPTKSSKATTTMTTMQMSMKAKTLNMPKGKVKQQTSINDTATNSMTVQQKTQQLEKRSRGRPRKQVFKIKPNNAVIETEIITCDDDDVNGSENVDEDENDEKIISSLQQVKQQQQQQHQQQQQQTNSYQKGRSANIASANLPNIIPKNNSRYIGVADTDWCLICQRNISRIVHHYVNEHKHCEVYTSRLKPFVVKDLRSGKANESIVSLYKNGQLQYSADCIFCGKSSCFMLNYWYQHYAIHTGEYAYRCSGCGLRKPTRSLMSAHVNTPCTKRGKILQVYSYSTRATEIMGYLCTLCNYVQLNRANIVKHLQTEHDITKIQARHIESIVLLKTPNKTMAQIAGCNTSGSNSTDIGIGDTNDCIYNATAGAVDIEDSKYACINPDDFGYEEGSNAGNDDENDDDACDDLSYMICGMLDVEMRAD